MVTRDKTCAYFIGLVLKRGGRWRNKQIEHAIARDYGVTYQNNTIAKYLSFFIQDGMAQSAPVRLPSGKTCDEYWLIEKKDKRVEFPVVKKPENPESLKDECIRIAKTYPHDHPQLKKIMEQIRNLESRERKAA